MTEDQLVKRLEGPTLDVFRATRAGDNERASAAANRLYILTINARDKARNQTRFFRLLSEQDGCLFQAVAQES